MTNLTLYSFNWLDYCFLAVILLSMIIGFKRGFIREIISLIIWILALMLPIAFSQDLAPLFIGFSKNEHIQVGVSFVAIFLAVFIIGLIINFIMKQVVSKTGMSGVDHFGGLIFGVFRGVALLAVLVAFLGITVFVKSASYQHSALVPRFEVVINKAKSIIPESKKSTKSSDHKRVEHDNAE